MPGHLFDQLRPPAGRELNTGVVSNHVAAPGHAVRRAAVARELRETRREVQLLRDRLAPED